MNATRRQQAQDHARQAAALYTQLADEARAAGDYAAAVEYDTYAAGAIAGTWRQA
ncbi:hypothetical protein [Streptomyces sp. A0592]|uniref:hypothetical protein n=1 Tax=Streptomyces sp. A0592 TaxID=2563099 RepID=UPI00144802F7|nr:hypothetical protein [Streptomyces sp. A0592]